MVSEARRLSDALGQLLLRDTRRNLHAELVDGIDGLDETLYPVLSGLARIGETTSSELATAVGLDRSVTSRHASALERRGLVTRRAHGHDGRASALTLTDRGRAAIALTRQRLDSRIAGFLAAYDPADAQRLTDMLLALTNHLRGHNRSE